MTVQTMPSQAQLARMRAQQESTMRDTCTIRRATGRGNDSAGGRTVGTVISVTTICRVAPMSLQREEVYAVQLRGRAGIVVTIPVDTQIAGTAVRHQDDVLLSDGRRVEIIGFSGPHTNETARQIYCMEMA